MTADALHTQREHADWLVTTKHAAYLLIVKHNQPPAPPLGPRRTTRPEGPGYVLAVSRHLHLPRGQAPPATAH
jgi:hypothetical protein